MSFLDPYIDLFSRVFEQFGFSSEFAHTMTLYVFLIVVFFVIVHIAEDISHKHRRNK